MHRILILLVPLLLAAGEAAPAVPAVDRPMKVVARLLTTPVAAELRTQVLPVWDKPVGDGFTVCAKRVVARLDDKGRLEIDAEGKGVFKDVPAKGGVVAIKIEREIDGKARSATLPVLFSRGAEGVWLWRNAGGVGISIAGEELLAVDVNGDGAFNTAGADGLLWNGQFSAFPLPNDAERWCTAKLDLTGFRMGPWGEGIEVRGHALATTVPAALPVLEGVNAERVKLGLTPRPELARLSSDLQKHCSYMVGTGQLAHPEDSGKPGYTAEGHASGMRSILSMGTAAERVAAGMVATLYHRQDVIRPQTLAFGVGYAGRFGGIDGRTEMDDAMQPAWPLLCPAPEQTGVPGRFAPESPDPIAGDKDAGFPVTAYFATDKLRLIEGTLVAIGKDGKPGAPLDCYRFDASTGGDPTFNRFQHVVCLIAKDPLPMATTYRVAMKVEVDGVVQNLAWAFQTEGAARKK